MKGEWPQIKEQSGLIRVVARSDTSEQRLPLPLNWFVINRV